MPPRSAGRPRAISESLGASETAHLMRHVCCDRACTSCRAAVDSSAEKLTTARRLRDCSTGVTNTAVRPLGKITKVLHDQPESSRSRNACWTHHVRPTRYHAESFIHDASALGRCTTLHHRPLETLRCPTREPGTHQRRWLAHRSLMAIEALTDRDVLTTVLALMDPSDNAPAAVARMWTEAWKQSAKCRERLRCARRAARRDLFILALRECGIVGPADDCSGLVGVRRLESGKWRVGYRPRHSCDGFRLR